MGRCCGKVAHGHRVRRVGDQRRTSEIGSLVATACSITGTHTRTRTTMFIHNFHFLRAARFFRRLFYFLLFRRRRFVVCFLITRLGVFSVVVVYIFFFAIAISTNNRRRRRRPSNSGSCLVLDYFIRTTTSTPIGRITTATAS